MDTTEICSRMAEARRVAFPDTPITVVARRHLDTDATTVRRWETGTMPTIPAAQKACEVYGMDMNWLVTGVGRKPRKAKVSA